MLCDLWRVRATSLSSLSINGKPAWTPVGSGLCRLWLNPPTKGLYCTTNCHMSIWLVKKAVPHISWVRNFMLSQHHIWHQHPWTRRRTTTISMLEIIKPYFTYLPLMCIISEPHGSLRIRYVSPVRCNNFHFGCSTPISVPPATEPGLTKPKDVSSSNQQSPVFCTLPPKRHIFHKHSISGAFN